MSDKRTVDKKIIIDLASIIGIVIGVMTILVGQSLEGGHVTSILQPTAALIVLGGTFGACLLQYKISVVFASFRAVVKVFLDPKTDNREVIREIIRIAYKARKEGIIALEKDVEQIEDRFLKRALTMAMDGIEPKALRDTMELEIANIEDEAEEPIKFWQSAGGYSPTIGILGAVLGLINVMENLRDPSKLGNGIAVAFVATVYGVGLANLLFLPISGKLKMKVKSQLITKEIMLVGVIGILEGENPRLIEDKLSSYLTRSEQEEAQKNDESAQKKAA